MTPSPIFSPTFCSTPSPTSTAASARPAAGRRPGRQAGGLAAALFAAALFAAALFAAALLAVPAVAAPSETATQKEAAAPTEVAAPTEPSGPVGPAASAQLYTELTAEAAARLEAAGFDPVAVTAPLRLEAEMARWAADRIKRGAPDEVRLKRLLRILYESEDADFQYQEGYTGGVAETFRTGRYNCLSFSMLYVTLARSLGLPAFFLSISRDQDFRRDGDLVVLTRHITAGYGPFADRTVLEFDVGPEIDYAAARPIDDTKALALFYSNRGAELLREDRAAEAEQKLDIAITLAPEIAQSWVNLGVAYRRLNRFGEARAAYEKAAELERDNIAAYQNLLILLRREGDHDSADELIDVLDQIGNRNPYTFLTLGDFGLEDGRLNEAGRFYRKAHRLARDEAETHAALGLWSMLVGKTHRARGWLRSARDLDPANERTLRLAREMASRGVEP